jgi:hypothetical protein
MLSGPLSLVDHIITSLDQSSLYIANCNELLDGLDTQLFTLTESRKVLVGNGDILSPRHIQQLQQQQQQQQQSQPPLTQYNRGQSTQQQPLQQQPLSKNQFTAQSSRQSQFEPATNPTTASTTQQNPYPPARFTKNPAVISVTGKAIQGSGGNNNWQNQHLITPNPISNQNQNFQNSNQQNQQNQQNNDDMIITPAFKRNNNMLGDQRQPQNQMSTHNRQTIGPNGQQPNFQRTSNQGQSNTNSTNPSLITPHHSNRNRQLDVNFNTGPSAHQSTVKGNGLNGIGFGQGHNREQFATPSMHGGNTEVTQRFGRAPMNEQQKNQSGQLTGAFQHLSILSTVKKGKNKR